eukprot:scaffold2458_cov61-Phaeocystis_antarctica.AAC.6
MLDKLHAWALTDYTSLAFVDSDVMAVAPLDVFDAARNVSNARGLLIARHSYDAVQVRAATGAARRDRTLPNNAPERRAIRAAHPPRDAHEQPVVGPRA